MKATTLARMNELEASIAALRLHLRNIDQAVNHRLFHLEMSVTNQSRNAEADAEEPFVGDWAERLKTAADYLKPPVYAREATADEIKAHRDLMSGVVSPEDQHPAFLPRTRLELQRLITGMEDDFTPITEPEIVELARSDSGPHRFFIRRDVRYPNGVVHPQALALNGQWVNRHVGFVVVGDDEIIWKGGR